MLFFFVLLLPLARADGDVPSGFLQCDRECRFRFHRFYSRQVTGVRVGALGQNNSWGRHCRCFDGDGQELTKANESIPRITTKPWNTTDFWCGPGDGTGFCTPKVCVLDTSAAAAVRTTTREEAAARNLTIVHCGACAACSHPDDVRVLYTTRHTITTDMTRCAAKFAKPSFFGGDHNLVHLRECLESAGITFDYKRRFVTPANHGDGPSCFDVWADNIMCDSTQCNTNPSCIAKFINPNNTGAFTGCLKCDEEHCGAEFIRGAGANRRSAGIRSDIERVGQQICEDGWYWPCTQCHDACGTDSVCNAKCEQTPSCQGPHIA